MNDFTIGRKAGAGMIKRQGGGGAGGGAQKFGSQRGTKDDGESPRKPRPSSNAPPPSLNIDELPSSPPPPPRRQPLYPSALSNASSAHPTSPQRTPRPRRSQQQQHRPNRKDEGPICYQSLEDLLRAAGYADVRIVTPESERLQARVASEKRRREERGFSSDDEENEVEALTKGVREEGEEGGESSSSSTPSPEHVVEEPSKPRGEAGGWLTWMSLGRKAGSDAVQHLENDSTVKAVTRRRSALDMVVSSSSSNPLPPPPRPTRSFATPPDSPTPQPRRKPTVPVPTSNRVSSLSSTECGSLSSSLSTNASTMIASPPDVPSRSFRGMNGESPTLSQGTPESTDRQWSPPRPSNATPVATRGDSESMRGDSESMRSLERARSQRSRAEARAKEMDGRTSQAEGSVEGRSRERSSVASGPSARTGSVDKGKKVATTFDEDSLANSLAAKSLRNITSQAALRASCNKIKPKSSFSFGSSDPATSSNQPPKPLRHAASTPFFSSFRPPLPPSTLSANSTQAVKASWFSTVSRNFFPTSLATPAATDTAFRRTANPHIRARPSIPSFHPSLSNASSTTLTTTLSSVSPRNRPLPTQVTSQTVFCSSESDEQLPAIVASSTSSSSAGSPTKTPVLSTKSSFSSGGGPLSDGGGGGGGGDAWKRNVAGAGWSWNVSTAMEEDLSFWGGDPSISTPSATQSSTSSSSTPSGRSLNAKGSIASLKAALAASGFASSLLNTPPVPPLPTSSSLTLPVPFSPPPPPPEIMISSPGTFEAGIKPRLLDLDTEEYEGRDPPEGSGGGGRRIWGAGKGSGRRVHRRVRED